MARLFNGITQQITAGTRQVPTDGSFSGWWYPTFSQNDALLHVLFFNRTDASNEFGIYKHTTNNLVAGWFTEGTDYSLQVPTANYALNTNAWNHLAMTWRNGFFAPEIYLNGVALGFGPVNTTTHATTGINILGNTSLNEGDASGRIAEFAFWNRVLAVDEVTMLAAGMSPLFLIAGTELGQGLQNYWPLIVELQDYISVDNVGTNVGTTAANDHPFMFYPQGIPANPTPVEVEADSHVVWNYKRRKAG